MQHHQVGIAGAGLMGHGIARNVLKHGHKLTVLEHPGNQPLDELKRNGARTAASAKELAAQSEIIILCVTGSPQVESVLCGQRGVIEGLRSGSIVIDCSTSVPATTLRMDKAVRDAGGKFVDAPMTRTAKEAHEGRLNLLVGGEDEVVQQVLPLLRCFAENVTHAGPVGSGHRLKLLHNFVSLGGIALIAEAAACAASNGIDPRVFVEVLAKGGGSGIALERLKPVILDPNGPAMQFSMANALKDLQYYASMVDEAHATDGIARAVAETVKGSLEALGKDAMVSDLVKALTRRNREGNAA